MNMHDKFMGMNAIQQPFLSCLPALAIPVSCYILMFFITRYFFHDHIRDVCEVKSEIASQTESSNIAKSKEVDYFKLCWK